MKKLFFLTILLSANFIFGVESETLLKDAKEKLTKPCYDFFKMYNEGKPNKAFAYSFDNNNKYTCRYTLDEKDNQVAKHRALKACEKERIKRDIKNECKIFAINSNIIKKKTIIPKRIDTKNSDLASECASMFNIYLAQKSHKAFAYVFESDKKYTCRFSGGSDSIQKAMEVALKSCTKRKKEKNIQNECSIYAIEEHIARPHKPKQKIKIIKPKTTPKSLPKVNKKTTISKPKKQKQKAKSEYYNLTKECRSLFRLYLTQKPNKAFAYAADNSAKFTCRFSANSDTVSKALEVALKSCERRKKDKKIKEPCQIYAIDNTIILKNLPKLRIVHNYNAEFKKAIYSGNLFLVKKYVNAGEDINTPAIDNSRAIFVSTARGDIEFTKKLINKKAELFFRTTDGNNLLVAAIMSGKYKMLKLILEQGLSPNKRCEDGNTPLHFAFMIYDKKMMKLLFKYGADETIKNKKGETVKALAKKYNLNLRRLKR